MTQRYGLPCSDAADAIERQVIGASYGTNGYTTLSQARTLVKALRLGPGVRLLDIGAGRGWPGLYLSEVTGCRAVLADVPLPALRIAVTRRDDLSLSASVDICRASGTSLPFRSGAFDAAVHTDTL
jgi:ubiquinone/menaquinone biosynthesis C-methylase UbiE